MIKTIRIDDIAEFYYRCTYGYVGSYVLLKDKTILNVKIDPLADTVRPDGTRRYGITPITPQKCWVWGVYLDENDCFKGRRAELEELVARVG